MPWSCDYTLHCETLWRDVSWAVENTLKGYMHEAANGAIKGNYCTKQIAKQAMIASYLPAAHLPTHVCMHTVASLLVTITEWQDLVLHILPRMTWLQSVPVRCIMPAPPLAEGCIKYFSCMNNCKTLLFHSCVLAKCVIDVSHVEHATAWWLGTNYVANPSVRLVLVKTCMILLCWVEWWRTTSQIFCSHATNVHYLAVAALCMYIPTSFPCSLINGSILHVRFH